MKYLFTLIALTVVAADKENAKRTGPSVCSDCQPEQIHIAFGEKINDIVVTWTTNNDTGESLVQFGTDEEPFLTWEVTGNRTKYKNLRGQWIHRATLRNLNFNTTYNYRCGSTVSWSPLFYLTTIPSNPTVLRAAIFGDMGVDKAKAIPYLQKDVENDAIDFILHVGDFAYDMHDNDSRKGDQYMRQIQPIATIVPYMVSPGNHEDNKNFTQYKSRMTMPMYQKWESMFYSWDVGPIHFVSINTEAYYFLNFGKDPLINQFRWLVQDLEQANSKKNRSKRPWIIMYGHRPMYCSGRDGDEITVCYDVKTRTGLDLPEYNENFAIEPLLMKYGVDIVFWAHEHLYERTWPIYDYKVYNGSTKYPYVNPKAPVHIITGAGGCIEKPIHLAPLQPDWCAFRSSDYSYTRFHAHNKTHVHLEQISLDLKGKVIDSYWIVQMNHGAFAYEEIISPNQMKKHPYYLPSKHNFN